MLRRLGILSFLLTAVCLHAQEAKFNLNVSIKGIKEGKAVISFPFSGNKIADKDTALIKKGKIHFTGKLSAPALCSVYLPESKIRFELFVEKGNNNVTADAAGKTKNNTLPVLVKGSKSNDDYLLVSSYYRKQIDSVYELSRAEKDDAKKKILSKELEDFQEKNKEKVMEFVYAHPNSAVSAYFLLFNTNDYNNDFKKIENLFNRLGPEAKESIYYPRIKEDYDAISRIQPGMIAPDFELKTADGKIIKLSSLRGRYLLLDFWASWCVPCRESFPQMKEIYNKYHGKNFEILGISDDSKREAWLNAVNGDKLPWINVIDEFPEKYKPARVGSLYAVHYIPSSILLDREGRIIAKNLHGEELIKLLEKLLNN